ncbi:hypothetical protein H6P81_018683 [Aristolochia fimbriata]|uniref:Uncharacterized protein n=1 Tax=Aristolochia fimbriata TaxID=158543 RepID=A0AAV7E2X9_ARIFI|nr:hypothetical protein H6P81_018683 [Aristolochia fimbriata]
MSVQTSHSNLLTEAGECYLDEDSDDNGNPRVTSSSSGFCDEKESDENEVSHEQEVETREDEDITVAFTKIVSAKEFCVQDYFQ